MNRVNLIKTKVSLEDLSDYDHVVVAGGAGTLALDLNLPMLRINKGQILTAKGSLKRSILCGGYLVNSETQGLIYVGSTYERDYESEEADLEKAIDLIGKKVTPYYPQFESLEFTGCRAGLRVVSPHHNVPLIKIIDKRTSVFTALGSRGLLYHALYGKKLAKAICFGDSILI
jgi:glycine/D-amino acid oxidase-like deaminating enzyme